VAWALADLHPHRPVVEHTELEEELHETAHIDYERVAIVRNQPLRCQLPRDRSPSPANLCQLQVPNPSVAALYEDALVYESGSAITSTGALTAYSGAKTGRSPLDKRIVKEPSSENEIWWG
jgi:phosphoenolpyruvate carboxykinase (ATP)